MRVINQLGDEHQIAMCKSPFVLSHLVQQLCMAVLLLAASVAQAATPLPLRAGLSENSQVSTIVQELATVLFTGMPDQQLSFQILPWTRVQKLLENGDLDMFVTFPASNRATYAHFTKSALFTLDYGHIVYDKLGSKAAQIEAATSFADMRNLVFVHQDAVEWEMRNVPSYIKRYTVNAPLHMFHMTFGRKVGDFFIMYPEQAAHFASQLGYGKQLGIRKVNFIPNSHVGLHIGIRKSYPGSKDLVEALDVAMQQPAYRHKASAIVAKFMRHDP